jgi:hypothetical protein
MVPKLPGANFTSDLDCATDVEAKEMESSVAIVRRVLRGINESPDQYDARINA